MKYKLLKIVWRDITYSVALMPKEEASDRIKPSNIIAIGFKAD